MIVVNAKKIYEFNIDKKKKWILIIYSISKKHYVGVPIYNNKQKDNLYIKSINKYINLNEISDYNINNIERCIYSKGIPIEISKAEYNYILQEGKKIYLEYLKYNPKDSIEGLKYLKWCKDKSVLDILETDYSELKEGGIYWMNLGFNVGSELRKLRPVILWRSSSDKKMWTIIPLTTKKSNDKYYFHYDIKNLNYCTARIESMMNYSAKRIISPYFYKGKRLFISKEDYISIINIIKKYYLFE